MLSPRLSIFPSWLACLVGLWLGSAPLAADWPHWRGPERRGVTAEESGWQGDRWSLQEAWSARVGDGCTSPLVVQGKVYTLGWKADKDTVCCLDAATGKEIWKTSYPCPRYGRHHLGDEVMYGGPSSTPEYDAETGYLYTLSCDGDLHCWDTHRKGHPVWSKNLYDRYRMPQRPRIGRSGHRDYGYTTAPLVHGNWLLVEAGGKEGNLVALDKRTGKHCWGSACRDLAGHTGGLTPLTVEGIPCLAVLTLTHLRIYRLDSGDEGQTLASYPWTTTFANNIATPTAHGNHVLITSAYNHYALCKIRITSRGASKVWEQPYPSKACSPVVHQGHIYLAWQRLRCIDLETGKLKWQGGLFGDTGSCLVTSDDRVIVLGNRGKLALVETAQRSPGAYQELAGKDRLLRELTWPHITVAAGRLYCKDRAGNLRCLKMQ